MDPASSKKSSKPGIPNMKLRTGRTLFATFVFLVLPLVISCSRKVEARRAFFYWRTVFVLSENEKAILRNHHIERLYLRLFDVALDGTTGRVLPVGRCEFRDSLPAGIEAVPVIFLANAVFEHERAPPELADKVWKLARNMTEEAGIRFRELQVDCDWSDGTREAFFAFCRAMKAFCAGEQIRLSATIRLHQIKYFRRTGVPPVDRGMLMFYNMGKIEANPTRTSIFNSEDASRYTPYLGGYPLPLDGALAIFSWVIHARANGQMAGLIEKTDVTALDVSPFLRRTSPGHYIVTDAAFFHGIYLKQGDTLVVEAMTPDLSRQSALMLADRLHPDRDFALSLFDLDERNLKGYSRKDLETLYTTIK